MLQFARLGWEVSQRRMSAHDAMAVLRMAERLLEGRPALKELEGAAKFIATAQMAAWMR